VLSNTLNLKIASLHDMDDIDVMTEEAEPPALPTSRPANDYHPVVDLRYAMKPTKRQDINYIGTSYTPSEK
jgi:hypothetical protein